MIQNFKPLIANIKQQPLDTGLIMISYKKKQLTVITACHEVMQTPH